MHIYCDPLDNSNVTGADIGITKLKDTAMIYVCVLLDIA